MNTSDTQTSADPADDVERMCDLVEEIAALLVDSPDDLTLDYETEGSSTSITLGATQEDLGRLLGRQGRTARALRTVLNAASARLGHRFSLDIDEVTEAA